MREVIERMEDLTEGKQEQLLAKAKAAYEKHGAKSISAWVSNYQSLDHPQPLRGTQAALRALAKKGMIEIRRSSHHLGDGSAISEYKYRPRAGEK